MAECNCCAFWSIALLRLFETTQDMVKRSDYKEADEVTGKYAPGMIENLKNKCSLDTKRLEIRLSDALSDIRQAEVAHEETVFSKIGLSLAAEGTYSKSAQANLQSAISELENAVRERAREMKCEL